MGNKYVFTKLPPKKELESLYVNGMSQTELGVNYGVSQKVIHSWFKKLEIKSRVAAKRNQTGERNSSWKGSDATYAAFQKRVETARGKPNICAACGDMDKPIYEWCNLTGKYDDVSDYMRMCRSCHRKYDKNRKGSSKNVKRTAK